PELRFEQQTLVAITGAELSASIDGSALAIDTPHACGAGSVLRFGERRSGTRAYIAFDGGIDVPLVLGSRATHVVSGLGGIDGRAIAAGDCLRLGNNQRGSGPNPRPVRRGLITYRSAEPGGARLRIMRGPQDDHFDEAAFDALQHTRF